MRIDFHTQHMCDFKAFSGKHVIHWDIPGLTFIRGENQRTKELTANGASKSSLFDAWCWCLFGRTPAGLRNPDVIPWNKSGNPSISNLVTIDGKEHVIKRVVGPNRLTFDDKDIDQDKLEEILGFNFVMATNTILLAQDQDLFFDLAPKDKMALFSDTLQLDRWDERSAVAHDKTNAAEIDATRAEQDRDIALAASNEVEQLLEEAKAAAETWAASRRVAKRDDTTKISDVQKYFDTIQQKLDEASLREDGAMVELGSLRKEESKLCQELQQAHVDEGIVELRLRKAKREVATCQAEIAKLAHAKTCPTCGQSVQPADLSKHKLELSQRLRALEKDLEAGVPVKLTAAVSTLEKRLESTRSYIKGFSDKMMAAGDAVNRLRPDVERARAQLVEMRKSLAIDQNETNPHQATIKGLQARLVKLDEDRAMAEQSLATARQKAERYKFWVKGFKDIKLQLIEEVLHELEIVTNGMLEDVGLVGWEMRYDIERETKSGTLQRALHVEIQSPDSHGFVRWESWSGGERQRLKLIGTLALSDVLLARAGVQTNLEILDEPATFWSAEGVQDLCAFLSARAKETNRSIYFVEHQAAQSAHFSHVITVVKDKQGAFIVEE